MKTIKVLIAVACAAMMCSGIAFAADEEKTCCEKAHADGGKECSHKCCSDAHTKGDSCAKCNPKGEDKKFVHKGDENKK